MSLMKTKGHVPTIDATHCRGQKKIHVIESQILSLPSSSDVLEVGVYPPSGHQVDNYVQGSLVGT